MRRGLLDHLWLIVLPTLWLAIQVLLGVFAGRFIAFGMGTESTRAEEDRAQAEFLAGVLKVPPK